MGYHRNRFIDMMHAGAFEKPILPFWAVTALGTLQTETACPADAPVVPLFERS